MGLTFRPTNHSHLLYLHVFMVGLPTLLSEKNQRLPQICVQRKYFWNINISTLPTILLSVFGPMLSRLINCATL